jgi:putative oxidoreductase
MEKWKEWMLLIGRILLVLIFLHSGIGKITGFENTTEYMANFGIPRPAFFLIGAIFIEVVGSLAVIFGWYTRLAALIIALYIIPATLIFHTKFVDPTTQIMFMKNVSMFGGFLILLAIGAGRLSLDQLLRYNKKAVKSQT